MDITIITAILTSTVLATIVNRLIEHWFRAIEYRREYFKTILKKRLEAYEWVETHISTLKQTVADEDGRPYHSIFSSGGDAFLNSTALLIQANSCNLWLNKRTAETFETLLQVFNKINLGYDTESDEQVIQAGKDNYHNIADLRRKLEECVRADIINLYKIKNLRENAPGKSNLIPIWMKNKSSSQHT